MYGTLNLKGQAYPLSFDFALTIQGKAAQATADFVLNRIDLALGLGTHPNDKTVGYGVEVSLKIQASKP